VYKKIIDENWQRQSIAIYKKDVRDQVFLIPIDEKLFGISLEL